MEPMFELPNGKHESKNRIDPNLKNNSYNNNTEYEFELQNNKVK